MPEDRGLKVRNAQRHDLALDGELLVSAEQGDQVHLRPTTGVRDGRISVTLTDLSDGGVGLMSPVYLPRRCVAVVRVPSPGAEGDMVLETPIRIQRVQMTDRRPGYLLGASFLDAEDHGLQRLLDLLNTTDQSDQRDEG